MQTCIMGARVIVHESIAEEFTRKFVAKANSIQCGDPALMTTQMGPVITKAQLDKVGGGGPMRVSGEGGRGLGGGGGRWSPSM